MAHLSIYRNSALEGVFYLPDHQVVIGRSEGVEIQLLDAKVSRRHAVIRKSVAGFMIQDLDTRNGTWVNRERVERSLLFHGDAVVIGSYSLKFEEGEIEEIGAAFVSTLKPTGQQLRVEPPMGAPAPNARARTNVQTSPGAMGPVPPPRDRVAAQPVLSFEDSVIEVEGLAPIESGEVPHASALGDGASIEIMLPGLGRPSGPGSPSAPSPPAASARAPGRPSVPPGKSPSLVQPAPFAPPRSNASTVDDRPAAARRVPDPKNRS